MFVCADPEAKIKRCLERAENGEKPTRKEIEENICRIDKNQARTREIITGSKWGERGTYHLTVNTTDWNIKELTPAVADFAACFFRRS
ncbi:MAG: cytidylate kinase family protein [Lachnospiraceae bacterium]|nr:cytidylate kinase family protein [Lachnospiraceae bacterium]